MRSEVLSVSIYLDHESDTFVAVSRDPECEVEAKSSTEAFMGLIRKVREMRDEEALA